MCAHEICPTIKIVSSKILYPSPGREICICNGFPRGHYLVWWVRVTFSLGVRVSGKIRVMVSNLLGSDLGQGELGS